MIRLALTALMISVAAAGCGLRGTNIDAGWWRTPADEKPEDGNADQYRYSSRYVPMRDGVRIAVDLYLPARVAPNEKIPTIMAQTRYWRNVDMRWPWGFLAKDRKEIIGYFTRHGYALVVVDVRGSGASFGTQPYPWAPDEIADGAQVVDWIVAQPWSSGKVGSAGGSYDGTAAEFLLSTGHTAIRAVGPHYSLYDVYTDIAFPGGVLLSSFTERWQKGNAAMDANRPGDIIAVAPFFTRGVMPVDEDKDRALQRLASAGHAANYRVHDEALAITFRDDVSPSGFSTDLFSPHTRIEKILATKTPIYNASGWYDGGYPFAAIKRFLNTPTPGSVLVLGPWNHGGEQCVDPAGRNHASGYDRFVRLRMFFDEYLKGIDRGWSREKPVHYFTMIENRWKAADVWPPPSSPTSWFFDAGDELRESAPGAPGEDRYPVDLEVGTGNAARWDSLIDDVTIRYPNRKAMGRRMRVYRTAPLASDNEITGHPFITIHMRVDQSDAQVFAYLEDEDERGEVVYVTEGMLRALHRKLSDDAPPYKTPLPFYRSFVRRDGMLLVPGETAEFTFDLLPVSWLFQKGHRIRVAIAGADKDHFRSLPGPAPVFRIERGGQYASKIVLPVVPRKAD